MSAPSVYCDKLKTTFACLLAGKIKVSCQKMLENGINVELLPCFYRLYKQSRLYGAIKRQTARCTLQPVASVRSRLSGREETFGMTSDNI